MLINSGQVRSFSFLHVSLYCFICPVVTDSMIYAAPVVEDRFVCSACQERNLQAIFSSKRALHNHMTKSKNPRCRSAGSEKIRVITRPGDVVAGGTGGMGPCPPPQHQPPSGSSPPRISQDISRYLRIRKDIKRYLRISLEI